jgi:hypothetical protein
MEQPRTMTRRHLELRVFSAPLSAQLPGPFEKEARVTGWRPKTKTPCKSSPQWCQSLHVAARSLPDPGRDVIWILPSEYKQILKGRTLLNAFAPAVPSV